MVRRMLIEAAVSVAMGVLFGLLIIIFSGCAGCGEEAPTVRGPPVGAAMVHLIVLRDGCDHGGGTGEWVFSHDASAGVVEAHTSNGELIGRGSDEPKDDGWGYIDSAVIELYGGCEVELQRVAFVGWAKNGDGLIGEYGFTVRALAGGCYEDYWCSTYAWLDITMVGVE